MKVKDGKILLDGEIIVLDDVAMIDVAQVGSPFDKPTFALSVVYPDGIGRTIAMTVGNSKLKLFRQLNKLGKQIINEGNNNFTDIGFALINIHYINSVKYDAQDEKIIISSFGKHINSFKATSAQAKRTLVKVEDAYNRYNQSRVQQL